uniref:WAT1-related protein n=1 Tax=Davidia involucrata TaxID=16924 RepID=A0A5B7A2U9_DAVIN
MQAVVGTVFRFSVATWCLGRRGPLYVSMFKPLAVVVAVGLGVIFVGDALYLGRYGFIYMLLNLFYKFKLKITANEVIMITWTGRDEPQKKKTKHQVSSRNWPLNTSHMNIHVLCWCLALW